MTKLLIRAGKEPYKPIGPETTLVKNTLGTNSGNMLFSHSVFRTLSTEGTTLVANEFKIDLSKADQVSEEYDAFVVPMASAFRLSFEKSLNQHTDFIKKLKIPVIVVGVGAQSTLDYDSARLKPIDASVKRFVSTVLNRSASIGVRGEFTAQYVCDLGFSPNDVDIIGCPSMFLDGPNLRIEKKAPTLTPSAKVAINISPYVKEMGDVLAVNEAKYPGLVYIPQDEQTLKYMVWGEAYGTRGTPDKNPVHLSHTMFCADKVRAFIDLGTWLSYLQDFDFAFGTRIHGNVAALLAGVPSFVIAHDSRTLELAKYHEIPHRRLPDLTPGIDAAELYAEANYDALNRGHQTRFERFTGFLNKNGLSHVYAAGQTSRVFDTKLREGVFPAALRPLLTTDSAALAERIRWLRATHDQSIKNLTKRVRVLEVALKELARPSV